MFIFFFLGVIFCTQERREEAGIKKTTFTFKNQKSLVPILRKLNINKYTLYLRSFDHQSHITVEKIKNNNIIDCLIAHISISDENSEKFLQRGITIKNLYANVFKNAISIGSVSDIHYFIFSGNSLYRRISKYYLAKLPTSRRFWFYKRFVLEILRFQTEKYELSFFSFDDVFINIENDDVFIPAIYFMREAAPDVNVSSIGSILSIIKATERWYRQTQRNVNTDNIHNELYKYVNTLYKDRQNKTVYEIYQDLALIDKEEMIKLPERPKITILKPNFVKVISS